MICSMNRMHFCCTCDTCLRSLCSKMVSWLLLFVCLLQGACALKLTKMDVPMHTVVGDTVVLRCLYDMEGDEVYSVKWYKSGREFYRFLPKDKPPAQIYEVSGVYVDMARSDQTTVTLKEVNLNSSGTYRCEISAEAPAFTTVSRSSEMLVIDLPDDGPKITGGRPKYVTGDTVRMNCTSNRSKPAALLSWTVNGGRPTKGHLREFTPHIDEDGLETSVLGLEFEVEDWHFKNGDMKLKCTAIIAPVYHQSNEESVSSGNHLNNLEITVTPSQVRSANQVSRTSSSYMVFFLEALAIFLLR